MFCLTFPNALGLRKEEPPPFPTESRGNSLLLNSVNFSKSPLCASAPSSKSENNRPFSSSNMPTTFICCGCPNKHHKRSDLINQTCHLAVEGDRCLTLRCWQGRIPLGTVREGDTPGSPGLVVASLSCVTSSACMPGVLAFLPSVSTSFTQKQHPHPKDPTVTRWPL